MRAKVMNHTHELSVRFDDVNCQEYCTVRDIIPNLHDPSLYYAYVWYAVSYGLICASNVVHHGDDEGYNRNIYLWNPLIQKYKTLPDSPLPSRLHDMVDSWEALAFGFVPEVNDYFVVHIYKPHLPDNHHSVIIGVYSLNTNSWKKKNQDKCHMHLSNMHDTVFVNGAAFWLGLRGYTHIAMCFDTKTEILREIMLPEWISREIGDNRVIHPFGQSLAYFVDNYENCFDMGVLKGDPINEYSWEKKMSVCTKKSVKPGVLGLRNNGEPLVTQLGLVFKNRPVPYDFHKLISYSLDSLEENEFVESWYHWNDFSYTEKIVAPPFHITPFVESLVFLDID
ncbi:uncharacterized protein LOC141672906 isoform X2 [Apium graveolens]|uniref:uncharacterized protein LOC141672906 isoform X2 n=1 Tax=Apium graveolens TaxID=4045 RepID=UPI003D79E054